MLSAILLPFAISEEKIRLDGCGKGYFGAEDGHTAKDAARSIRERGKEAHAQGLNEAREG